MRHRVSGNLECEPVAGPPRGLADHRNLVVPQLLDRHILAQARSAAPSIAQKEPRVSSSSIHVCLTVDRPRLQRTCRAPVLR